MRLASVIVAGAVGLAVGLACTVGSPGAGAPATHAPAGPTESFATVTTSADPVGAAAEDATDPYAATACPTDLAIDVGARSLDGRRQADTIHARYTREHLKPVTASQLIARDEAIARVVALEGKHPGLVPAGFRADLAAHGRDPSFRMYLARCELADPITLRRASHDAALAYLLGAPPARVRAVLTAALQPDGPTSLSCRENRDCEVDLFCDPAEKSCMSEKARTTAFLSAVELDVEDVLVRGLASLLTPAMIEDPREDKDDVIGTFVYDRYVRCTSGTLCNFTRYSTMDGGTTLVTWDKRDRGEVFSVPDDDARAR